MRTYIGKNSSKITTVAVAFEAGSALEAQHGFKAGTAHFLEHFMFKGSDKRDFFQRSKEMAFLGAEDNAFTSHTRVVYYFSVMEDCLEKGLEILSDMILNPAFPESQFEKEKKVILEELASGNDDVSHVMADKLYEAFASNYFSKSVIGTEDSISAIQLQDLKDFYNKFYKKENMFISVQTSLKKSVVKELLVKYFGEEDGIANGLITHADSILNESKKILIDRKDLEQAHVFSAYPSFKRGTKESMAATVLSSILGNGMDSRLFQEVREKNNLVYGIDSSNNPEQTLGIFLISFSTRAANLERAIDVVNNELKRIISEPPSEEELQRSKNKIKTSLYRSFQSAESSCMRIIDNYFINGKLVSIEDLTKKFDAVTIEDVAFVAEKIFSSPNVLVVAKKAED